MLVALYSVTEPFFSLLSYLSIAFVTSLPSRDHLNVYVLGEKRWAKHMKVAVSFSNSIFVGTVKYTVARTSGGGAGNIQEKAEGT